MKIRIMSDLHLELADFMPAPAEADVVVLAGDIGEGLTGVEWAARAFPDVPILYVAGNHEYYDHDMEEVDLALANRCQGRIQFLKNDVYILDGVRFVGTTLWADFSLFDNPKRDMAWCSQHMNDYNRIKKQSRRLRPEDTLQLHTRSRAFLTQVLAEPFDGKTVVITHHAPSIQSIPVQHQNKLVVAAYASNLDELTTQADIWIHGHVHEARRYQIGKCTVQCNPRGYVRDSQAQKTGFKDPCTIEV